MLGNIKEKLHRGETMLGGWMMIGHPTIAEIMAGEGLNFICVDMEHTSIDIRTFHEIALAVKGTGCELLARLDCCNVSLAKRVLDMGANGIIVPSVNTPEMAQTAVRMATYPPQGTRGTALSRASDFERNFSDYFDSFNVNVLIIIMIEHIEAIQNIDSILSTPGIDAAFIGPYDLSASMGLAGQLDHPDVRAAQQNILNACHRHNIPPGIHVVAPNTAELRSRLEQGFSFIALADVVSIHLPAVEATRHFVNAERLGRMRPNEMLVNTARGWVLDENALYDALADGKIAGAALDVFENEPYRPVSPAKDLRTLENAVLTPHIGSNTQEANQRMARACLENISCFFAGRLDELTRVDAII